MIACELPTGLDSTAVFRSLGHRPHCLYLDSAQAGGPLGRYSFVAADPFDFLSIPADGQDALGRLARRLAAYRADPIGGLPGFQGGAAGLFGYDLGRSLERLPRAPWDEFAIPALAVGFYDTVVAFDHERGGGWIISSGFPENDAAARRRRAQDRIDQFRRWIDGDRPPAPARANGSRVSPRDLSPQFPVGDLPRLTSNFSEPAYRDAVRRVIDYIHAGDVFQVNVAQRLMHPAIDDALSLYLRLRKCNPAPFAGYFDLGAAQIVSASPERFLELDNGRVEARPIKGTRQRSFRPEADLFSAGELQASEKDRAENLMIVDLLRNDLARACRADSVRVTELCRLELYQFVQHLVSAVVGELAPGRTAIDLVRATFPGGSITGAPKVRAMEIISEIEPNARGAYCGSLGYVGFDGRMDLNILIRTITVARGWWQIPVGGGVVAQSSPEREYEETWHKATGMLRALGA